MYKVKPLNQQDIKYINLKKIYTLIDNSNGISRAKIAKKAKLSKTTVSALVDELLSRNYILDMGVGESNKTGRKPNVLCLNHNKNVISVINWNKSKLDIALVNTANKIIFVKEILLKEGIDYVEQIKNAFYDEIIPQANDASILGVCVVVPGMIDDKNKKINSTILPIKAENQVIERLREGIGQYPIAFFNDTACLAYAETVFTQIKEKSYAFININKGVGTTLFSDGKMFRGANGMATQFGHYSIDRNGPKCTCGNKGCLERLIGENYLVERVQECDAQNSFGNGSTILFKDIGEAVRKGDEKSIQLMSLLAEDLTFALSNLVTMFNPELIIIGGAVVNLGDLFFEIVQDKLHETGFHEFTKNVQLRHTQLEGGAEIKGAAKYYMDTHFDFGSDMNNKVFLF